MDNQTIGKKINSLEKISKDAEITIPYTERWKLLNVCKLAGIEIKNDGAFNTDNILKTTEEELSKLMNFIDTRKIEVPKLRKILHDGGEKYYNWTPQIY